jgi:hypothetical protein
MPGAEHQVTVGRFGCCSKGAFGMRRYSAWFASVVLLASCSQHDAPPAAQVPAASSSASVRNSASTLPTGTTWAGSAPVAAAPTATATGTDALVAALKPFAKTKPFADGKSVASFAPVARAALKAPFDVIQIVYDSKLPDSVVLNGSAMKLDELPAALKAAWRSLSPMAAAGKPDPWAILKIELDKTAKVEALHRIHDAAYDAGARRAELVVPGAQNPDDGPPWPLKIDIASSVDSQETAAPNDGRKLFVFRVRARDDGEIRNAALQGMRPFGPGYMSILEMQKHITIMTAKAAQEDGELPVYTLSVDEELLARRLVDAILACERDFPAELPPKPRQLLESVRLTFFPHDQQDETTQKSAKKIEPSSNLAPGARPGNVVQPTPTRPGP